MVSYNIPLIFTKNARETASLLAMIARKEQEFTPSTLQQHGAKPATPEELLEYVVSSLPNIGTGVGEATLGTLLDNQRNRYCFRGGIGLN
jgi:ERCC4-type nuclease